MFFSLACLDDKEKCSDEKEKCPDDKEKSSDYKDFLGKEVIVFEESLAEQKFADSFVSQLKQGPLNHNDFSVSQDAKELIKSACYAFSKNQITREQMATLLELYEISIMSSKFEIIRLKNNEIKLNKRNLEIKELNNKSCSLLDASLNHFLQMEPAELQDKDGSINKEKLSLLKQDFFDKLEKKPTSEAFLVKITLNVTQLPDWRIVIFLYMAHRANIIYIENFDKILDYDFFAYYAQSKIITFAILSVGARNALMETIYEKNAKLLLPRLGKFSIDDIKRGMLRRGRYAFFHYPGIKGPDSFHGVVGPDFFISLHDEFHRKLISRIHNDVYNAYLYACNLIVKKTGIQWSKDLWNAFDLEVNPEFNQLSCAKQFSRLLSASVASTLEPIGLFGIEEECLDTLLIIMIDLVENAKQDVWNKIFKNGDLMSDEYDKLLRFVVRNLPLMKDDSTAVRVAKLKGMYLNKSPIELFNSVKNVNFEKREGYIQVVIGNQLIGKSKARMVEEKKYAAMLMFIKSDLDLIGTLKNVNEIRAVASYASHVVAIIEEKVKNQKPDQVDYQHYTEILKQTQSLLHNPADKKAQKKYRDLIAKQKSLQDTKMKISGIMLAFLGAVTIAASIIVTGLSLGLSLPLTIFSFAAGTATFASGVGLFSKTTKPLKVTHQFYDKVLLAETRIGVNKKRLLAG